MSDIHAKYQKLATEYSKLRAQVPVLKKAIIDEQTKEDELRENLKEKDQSIRKYEQELDSVIFRNQQLASRVSFLQQELDQIDAKAKKGKKQSRDGEQNDSHPVFTSQSSVIGEELQNKIEENARLHRQVYDSSQEYELTVGQLQEKLMHLEAETKHHQEVLNAAVQQSRSQIDNLQDTKISLEAKLQKQESEAKQSWQRACDAESTLEHLKNDLTSKLDKADHTIQTKLPFNDMENSKLNSLNVPAHDRSQQLQTRELVGQAMSLIKELVQGLSNYYTYSEQRTKTYPVDADQDTMSDVNRKYCKHLHENSSYLRPIEQAFKLFHDTLKDEVLVTLETATGLEDFSIKFKSFTSYANKLLPYQLLSLEEECSISSCTSSLEAKNMELHAAFKTFVSSLSKLDTYISIIATQSNVFDNHPKSSHFKIFEILAAAATDFHQTTRELCRHYNDKVSLEHQLPTASQKLRSTDECIVSALTSLVTCTSKISALLGGNLEFFKKVMESDSLHAQHTHPYVNCYRQKAAQYMSLISRPCPESVPYNTALHNRRTLISSTESRDTLIQQVVGFQEKICKLEQDKEHWMLESQLVQMKYSKESQKVSELEQRIRLLEARLTGSIEDNLESVASNLRPEPIGSAEKAKIVPDTILDTSMLGEVESLCTGETDSDNREQLIRQHFSNRITELTSQLQLTDSKALYFHAECRALHQQLQLCKRDNDVMEADLTQAKQAHAQLKDELQTTTRSYEGQLSMMSEHLAAINEKLTTQKDEIDVLKFQLNNSNKVNKKGRVK